MFNTNNTNTNSPRRRLMIKRPAILGLPDRTSTSVSSNSYSSDNENNATSTETNTSIRRVYNTTHTDTNTNQRRSSSTSRSRFLRMLEMVAMLSIVILSLLVVPVGYTSDLPIQVLNKSTGGSSTSTSTGVSLYIENAHNTLLNSKSGILPDRKTSYAPRIMLASDRRVRESDDRNKSILYMMWLDLPRDFLEKIRKKCYPLWYRLVLVKIGHSQDWDHFLEKMKILQVYIPFCRLKYIAIEHHHLPSKPAEQAMHYVFMAYHVNGEWYYMNGMSKMYLMSKFPGSNIYLGYTTRPGRGSYWTHEEGQGHVYLAKFDWDTRVLPTCRLGAFDTIRGILDDPTEPVEHKDIAEDMLLTKTGSTIDIRHRMSKYTYAQVFANITYHAIPSLSIRADELALQQDWHPYWKVGEWYALDYPEDWYQVGNATYSLVIHPNIEFLHDIWYRTLEQTNIYRHDLEMWQNMGLVSDADIVYNHLCGLVDVVTGMPH